MGLCGRAPGRFARSLAVPVSYACALRLLRRVPVPEVRIPRVIGVDDFALRRRQGYATVVINAGSGERIEVPSVREAVTVEAWLCGHPGIEAVCRDGSAAYAEAVRRALPDEVQISDRRRLWHRLAEAVRKEEETGHHHPRAPATGPRPARARSRTSAVRTAPERALTPDVGHTRHWILRI